MQIPSTDDTVTLGGEAYESVHAASARTRLSVTTLRKYIAAGDLPASRLGTRKIVVKVSDVDRLIRPIPSATTGTERAS